MKKVPNRWPHPNENEVDYCVIGMTVDGHECFYVGLVYEEGGKAEFNASHENARRFSLEMVPQLPLIISFLKETEDVSDVHILMVCKERKPEVVR